MAFILRLGRIGGMLMFKWEDEEEELRKIVTLYSYVIESGSDCLIKCDIKGILSKEFVNYKLS